MTVPLWLKVQRTLPASLVAAVGLTLVGVTLSLLRGSAYREPLSVAPALVLSALAVAAVTAVLSAPEPEELTRGAVRSLVGVRFAALVPVITVATLISIIAVALLRDGWFAVPFVQSCSVALTLALLAHTFLPALIAPAAATGYIAVCYFGGRSFWNMILHERSTTLALTWLLLSILAAALYCLRGPTPRPANDPAE